MGAGMLLTLTDAKTAQSCQSLAQIGWNYRESRASGARAQPTKRPRDACSGHMKPVLKEHSVFLSQLEPLHEAHCWPETHLFFGPFGKVPNKNMHNNCFEILIPMASRWIYNVALILWWSTEKMSENMSNVADKVPFVFSVFKFNVEWMWLNFEINILGLNDHTNKFSVS